MQTNIAFCETVIFKQEVTWNCATFACVYIISLGHQPNYHTTTEIHWLFPFFNCANYILLCALSLGNHFLFPLSHTRAPNNFYTDYRLHPLHPTTVIQSRIQLISCKHTQEMPPQKGPRNFHNGTEVVPKINESTLLGRNAEHLNEM